MLQRRAAKISNTLRYQRGTGKILRGLNTFSPIQPDLPLAKGSAPMNLGIQQERLPMCMEIRMLTTSQTGLLPDACRTPKSAASLQEHHVSLPSAVIYTII